MKVHPSYMVIKKRVVRYGARNCLSLNAAAAGFGFPTNFTTAKQVCLITEVLSVRLERQFGMCFREFVLTAVGCFNATNSSSLRHSCPGEETPQLRLASCPSNRSQSFHKGTSNHFASCFRRTGQLLDFFYYVCAITSRPA